MEWAIRQDKKAGSIGRLPAFYGFAGEVKVWVRLPVLAWLQVLVWLPAQAELVV